MKRKIRFERGFGDRPVVDVTLGEYVEYDIDRASGWDGMGQLEATRAELNELRGYFERLLNIIEPDLSEAQILTLCKRSDYDYDRFEIVEVEEEAFAVAEEDEDLDDR